MESYLKRFGMLVFTRRGVNQGFWPHLGVQDEAPLFLAVKVSFK